MIAAETHRLLPGPAQLTFRQRLPKVTVDDVDRYGRTVAADILPDARTEYLRRTGSALGRPYGANRPDIESGENGEGRLIISATCPTLDGMPRKAARLRSLLRPL